MSAEMDPTKIRHAVKLKAMNLIAQREHSEKELREKLTLRFAAVREMENIDFVETVIDETVQMAKERKWLSEPAEAAHRLAEGLHQRNKGIHYINNYLSEKGLPGVEMNSEREFQKARAAAQNKFPSPEGLTSEEKNRLARFLSSRGFDSETVRKVLNEKL